MSVDTLLRAARGGAFERAPHGSSRTYAGQPPHQVITAIAERQK
ncbi:hypothetical protein OH146_00395 [Salinibacterium sp. SYSU T00001]|nr:hypothetical protein [Salinibacterium sedimenticola]MCW4384229.1 hypothetical protein [Salinibacterium sedimenticola]